MGTRERGRVFRVCVLASAVAGVALTTWAVRAVHDPLALGGVLIASFAFSSMPAHVRPGLALSLINVVAFSAIALGGPALAVPVAVGAVLAEIPKYARPVHLRIGFNLGQLAIAGALGGLVYEGLAPDAAVRLLTQQGNATALVSVEGAGALVAAALVFSVVNFGSVALAIALNTGERVLGALRSAGSALVLQPLYLALSVLAIVLIVDVHPAAVVLLVVPAIVARTGLVALQREAEAYDELVLALVKLIEVKDGYTRGHAERVALLAVEVAGELGYDFEQRRTTRYSALLHDVGKIAVSLQILRKPSALTDDEYVEVKTHPEIGVDVLSDIDFLAGARPGILHHHERVDGRGYPHGLRGDEIPELARIITVVDAFDAMTSTRAYRRALDVDTALGRIRAGAGTQFDARIVAAFERVLGRVDWTPTQGGDPGREHEAADGGLDIDLVSLESRARV